eukprot:1145608-Rhodomonas_salina.1
MAAGVGSTLRAAVERAANFSLSAVQVLVSCQNRREKERREGERARQRRVRKKGGKKEGKERER